MTISVNILTENLRLLHRGHADLDQQVATKCMNMAAQFHHLVVRCGTCKHQTSKFRMLSVKMHIKKC